MRSFKHSFSVILHSLYIETHRTEPVVARDHGAVRILHPSVKEIPAAAGELESERLDHAPRGFAEAVGTLPILRDVNLAELHIACVLDRVLVPLRQVRIFRTPDGGETTLGL